MLVLLYFMIAIDAIVAIFEFIYSLAKCKNKEERFKTIVYVLAAMLALLIWIYVL